MSELKAIESATAVIGNVHLVYDKYEADREIRKQKRKRCLAMARICYMKSWNCLQYFSPREKYGHWKKWETRWTELANKFKEAK